MGTYTGYFDESNDEEQPKFVIGGFVLDAERINSFDQDWLNVIRQLPPLRNGDGRPHLHTTDFVSGNGVYDPEWKGRYPEKLEILTEVARLIHKYATQVFTCVLDMEDYVCLDEEAKLSEAIGHPYALAVRLAYQQLAVWAHFNASDAPVKMFVEVRKGFGEVNDLFVRDGAPVPATAGKSLPALQAADYIAWVRGKKLAPTSASEAVIASWEAVGKWLLTDQKFGLQELADIWVGHCMAYKMNLPFRDDDETLLTFDGNTRNPRRPFKRKRKRNMR